MYALALGAGLDTRLKVARAQKPKALLLRPPAACGWASRPGQPRGNWQGSGGVTGVLPWRWQDALKGCTQPTLVSSV